MKHTKESVIRLLERNDEAVRRGLRVVKRECGFCWGGWSFGCDLIRKMDNGSTLSKYQLDRARELLREYAVILARVANDLEAMESAAAYAEARAELFW